MHESPSPNSSFTVFTTHPLCRLFRMGGTFGTAIVTWEITPADSNTFSTNTGGVVFGDGNSTADIVIQVPYAHCVLCVSMYCMYPCTVCIHVLYVSMYCMYPCTVCIRVLYVSMYCMYPCTVCIHVLCVSVYCV